MCLRKMTCVCWRGSLMWVGGVTPWAGSHSGRGSGCGYRGIPRIVGSQFTGHAKHQQLRVLHVTHQQGQEQIPWHIALWASPHTFLLFSPFLYCFTKINIVFCCANVILPILPIFHCLSLLPLSLSLSPLLDEPYRVRLLMLPGMLGSDYINASYIDVSITPTNDICNDFSYLWFCSPFLPISSFLFSPLSPSLSLFLRVICVRTSSF